MKRSLDVAVLVAVLATFLVLNLLLFGRASRVARRAEIVPVPTTWRTTPSGCRAFHDLLGRLGFRVERWVYPTVQPLPADVSVYILLEPELYVRPFEALELRRFADRGGTVIVAADGVRSPTSPARELPAQLFLRDPDRGARRVAAASGAALPYRVGDRLRWSPGAGEPPSRYLAGVRSLELDPAASRVPPDPVLLAAATELTDDRRAWPVAGEPPGWLCTLTAIGRGRVFCLPTAALFANGQLARGDNARFAVNLVAAHAGSGRVLFDEYHLGNLGAESVGALLWRPPWRWVTLQLLLAVVLLLGRLATRFGPVRREPEGPARRPASEYVTALAGLYQRAGAREEVARLWAAQVRGDLARLLALPARASDAQVAARLRAAGAVGEAAARAWAVLQIPPADDDALLTAAQAASDAVAALAAARGGTGDNHGG